MTAGESWLIEGTGTAVDNVIYIGTDATVTLNGINITDQIECAGDATIILADGSENKVTVSTNGLAGIQIGGTGKTLTINGETAGDGKLTVQGGSGAAGIGTSMDETGGNIVINGGTVTATGGNGAAGIGTGYSFGSGAPTNQTCGDITINGGIVTATGGMYGAGIGTGYSFYNNAVTSNECGAITIGTGVTSVTAIMGTGSPISIGMGASNGYSGHSGTQTCGTITFGTAAVFNGAVWSPAPMVAGTYGGLTLAISTTTNADDTWTLTPVAP